MMPFTLIIREYKLVRPWPKKVKTYTQTLKWLFSWPDYKKDELYQYYIMAIKSRMSPRDHRVEYVLYGSTAREKHKTKLRQKNRKFFQKLGLVSKYDRKQIHHKNGNVYDNRRSNLEVISLCDHHKKHGRQCRKSKYY
jgi:hypothetical protein